MKTANPLHQVRSLPWRARSAVSGAAWRGRPREGAALCDRFQSAELVRCRRGVRFFCWLPIALLAMSAVNSYFQEPALFTALLRIRTGSACLIGVLLVLLCSRLGRRRLAMVR
jgi:hypothetical protein